MKFLICGGYGFIGSEFIRNHFEHNPNDKIINIDNLSLGSNRLNLEIIENHPNYVFKEGNITDVEFVKNLSKDVDVIINFAAETHVDRSIANPKPFLDTNIYGTYSLLEASKEFEKLSISFRFLRLDPIVKRSRLVMFESELFFKVFLINALPIKPAPPQTRIFIF